MVKYITGDDGDREWLCEHGVGHGNNVHTCEGCCGERKLEEKKIKSGKKLVGRLVLHNYSQLSPASKQHITSWLRKLADDLEHPHYRYGKVFVARHLN